MADTVANEKMQLQQLLTCPVCRDIFKDPRQLPCGHSLCLECVEKMVDHTSEVPFRCPDCREYFGTEFTTQYLLLFFLLYTVYICFNYIMTVISFH
uniref:RING-type domain-containing protein n=1 Tax=Neogobius melanostomus TaxID=47308 RepID=A0A8C6UHC1_9GOBI